MVWMASTRPLISKSFSPCTNPLVIIPRAPFKIGISVTFMFHSFSIHKQCPGTYLSFRFLLLCGQPGQQSPQFSKFCFSFFFIITCSGRLAEIRWSVVISKSQRSLYVSFSRTDSGLCIYHLLVWSNFNFLHNSKWITLPIQSCLFLYSFCDNLLHLLMMGLTVSSLSPQNQHILFIIIIYSSRVFHISISWWFFHWSLSDSKSPQFSRTRLSILAVLSNTVVWIVSTRPLTSKSSRPFNNPLVTVPNATITIGTIVTFIFHSFFNSLARSRYLSFFSLSFRFILWSPGQQSQQFCRFSFFCWLLWGLVFWPGLGDPFVC